MKRNLFIILIILISIFVRAEEGIIKLNGQHEKVAIKSNNQDVFAVKFSFDEILSFQVTSEKGVFTELKMEGLHAVGELGSPKLPAVKKLIEIPFGATYTVTVKNYTVNEYILKDYGIERLIMPVQPSLPKSVDIENVVFEYNEAVYKKDVYIKHSLAEVHELGTLRSTRIARLEVAPVEYNPVKGSIKVYNNIELEVRFTGADTDLNEEIKLKTYSPYFVPVYKTLLNNNTEKSVGYPDHPDLMKYPVKYLIISDRMFEETLQDFINWKAKKGFNVIVAYTDEIGTTVDEIKTYIHNVYNTATETDPAPSFVLFVGDTPQIPASATGSSSGKKTDLYYCSVDGDYFPEMYYGRFSATSPEMLANIIEKTLYYEQYQFADPSYLDRVTLIAGADGTWNPAVGQPTIKYGTENYFNTAHGYATVNDYLDSYTGCFATIDEGLGFINYTAHCNETSWQDPSFNKTGVNALQNINMYPLAIGNCCLAADFGYDECVGETWLRAEKKGAVAYIGSSPSSYWFEDFYWSVGAFPINDNNGGYVPTVEETTWGAYDVAFMDDYVAVDALVFIGNLAVTEVDIQGYPQHSSPTYYWQAYNCLGDPSLVAYHTQGKLNEVTYGNVLHLGADEFEVSAIQGSYVAISSNGVLQGVGMTDETGLAVVKLNPVLEPGYADIVVTKPQYQPFVSNVEVKPLQGAFVLLDSTIISDSLGNLNYQIESGEQISFGFVLKNVGMVMADQVEVILRSDDQFVQIIDSLEHWGNIDADTIATIENAFTFLVTDSVDDQHMANFSLQISDTNVTEPWFSNFSILVNAPSIQIADFNYTDTLFGNSNRRLDPGETVQLMVNVINTGHAETKNLICSLFSENEFISINKSDFEVGSLLVNDTAGFVFELTLGNDINIGEIIDIQFSMQYNSKIRNVNLNKIAGSIMEDFETGDLTRFVWNNSTTFPWLIDNTNFYQGNYSLSSGDPDHQNTSSVSIDLVVEVTDSVSFYKRVSSENEYDFFRFFINGTKMDQWSGEVGWSYVGYPIEPGEYTFTWSYIKDESVSSGADKAWIDNVVLPGTNKPFEHNHIPEFKTQIDAFDTVALAGMVYEYLIETEDLDNDSIVITAPVLPGWLSLIDYGDGTALLSGIPENQHQGDTLFVLRASDGQSYDEMAFYFTVFVPDNVNEINKTGLVSVYPNPLNNKAMLSYTLMNSTKVSISLFNILGTEVQTIVPLTTQNKGSYNYVLEANKLHEGIYFCKISMDNFTKTLPIVVTK